MWHDGPVVLRTCPVREFTGDVQSVLRWFGWTYRLELVPFVGATWVRDSWPAAGSAGEQDAWLTHALETVAETRNAMLREDAKRQTPKTKKGGTSGQRDRRRSH